MTRDAHTRSDPASAFRSAATVTFRWRKSAKTLVVLAAGCTLLAASSASFGLAAALTWSFLATTWFITAKQAKGVELSAPRELVAFSGTLTRIPLALRNRSSSWSARDLLLHVREGKRDARHITAVVAHLERAAQLETFARSRFTARGIRELLTVTLYSTYPFGLFEVVREYQLPCDFTVLPRIGRLTSAERHAVTPRGIQPGGRTKPNAEGDYHSLRDWRAGEPLRGVAWKPSARRGRRLVRQWTTADRDAARVILAVGSDANLPLPGQLEAFERAVSTVATLLFDHARRGNRYALTIADETPYISALQHGIPSLLPLLKKLAVVQYEARSVRTLHSKLNLAERAIHQFIYIGDAHQALVPRSVSEVTLNVNGWEVRSTPSVEPERSLGGNDGRPLSGVRL